MYLKTAIILAALASTYGLLVFVAEEWWQALPLEKTCREFGVSYKFNTTLWSALGSHYRWLRTMGRPGGEGDRRPLRAA